VTCASYNCSKFAGSRDTETSPVFVDDFANSRTSGYNPTVDGVKMRYLIRENASWSEYFHSNAGSGVFQRSWSPSLSQGTLTLNEKLVIDFAAATGNDFLSGSYSGVDKAGLGLNDDNGSFVVVGPKGVNSLLIDFNTPSNGDFIRHYGPGSDPTGLYYYNGALKTTAGDDINITKHLRFLEPDGGGEGDAAIATSFDIRTDDGTGVTNGTSWGTSAEDLVILEPK